MFEVGLEFDSRKITATVFTQKRNMLLPKNLGFAEIEKHAVDGIKIIDPVVFAGTLKELWKKYKIRNKSVNIGVSDSEIVVKEIKIPAIDNKEIDNAIRYQLEEFIPIARENIIYDYYIIEKKKNTSTVMLVGIFKDTVNKIVSVFKSAALRINSIEASCFSLFRLADYYINFKNKFSDDKNKADCIVYFGNEISIIELADITGLRYPRFIKSSLLSFQKNLIKKTSLLPDEALGYLKTFDFDILSKENDKKNPVLIEDILNTKNEGVSDKKSEMQSVNAENPDNLKRKSIKQSADQFITEISRSIGHFLQENRNFYIDNIFFCGFNIKNMEKYLAENINHSLTRTDFTDRFLPGFLRKNRFFEGIEYETIADSILISSGLAIRGLKK